jgi:polyhydroxyalkanoate synthase
MSTRKQKPAAPSDAPEEIAARAAEGMLGPNPFIGLRTGDVLAGLGEVIGLAARRPMLLLEQEAALVRELISAAAGSSELAPAAGDKRFLDAAWQDNPFYRMMLQAHLAWSRALAGMVERCALEGASKERARFSVSLLTDAFAPTNTLIGNPAALKKFIDTGGTSILKGLQNLLQDLYTNQGMPAQVDTGAFELGRNLAASPGAVVFRNEVLELIHYAPATETVYALPHLLVPPQVNKFYVFDLSPGKSIIEFLVKGGFQTFTISWRNRERFDRWGHEAHDIIDALDGNPGYQRAKSSRSWPSTTRTRTCSSR